MRLIDFLTQRQIPHTRLSHRPAYTANRIAQVLHVPGQEMAKTVLVRTDHGHVLAVLPSTCLVDLDELRQMIGEEHAWLASESEIETLFPDCERGAMPPFGSLYDLPTLVDESMTEDDEIVFEGETHQEAIRMRFADYLAVEHPRFGHFASRN